MNNKGFTLIELIASILLLGVIMSVTAGTVVNLMESSKQKSYDLLIENIKIGAQGYFEECENQDPNDKTINSCPPIENNEDYTLEYFTVSLEELLNYGFLKSSSKRENVKIVENPKTNENINPCQIKITKEINKSNYTVSYEFENVPVSTIGVECPTY